MTTPTLFLKVTTRNDLPKQNRTLAAESPSLGRCHDDTDLQPTCLFQHLTITAPTFAYTFNTNVPPSHPAHSTSIVKPNCFNRERSNQNRSIIPHSTTSFCPTRPKADPNQDLYLAPQPRASVQHFPTPSYFRASALFSHGEFEHHRPIGVGLGIASPNARD